jgi:hypothetical protein
MLLLPLIVWTTVIYLAMAAVHTLFSLAFKLVQRLPRTARQSKRRPVAIARLQPPSATFRFSPVPVGPRS